jgi:hypothetical protein
MRKELLIAQFAAGQKQSESGESTGRRKDLVFYSGAEIERFDWWTGEEYTIQFSLKKGDFDFSDLAGAPFLKDHRMSVDTTIGHIENPRIENGVAMATAIFADTDDVKPIWEKVEGGHIRDVSMGVAIDRLDMISDMKKEKKKRYMATGWKPYEISAVPDGADPIARFVMSQADESMPADVREFLRGLYQRKEFLNELYEGRESLRSIVEQHLAKAGAASTADSGRDKTLALMRLRQRQYGYAETVGR